MTSRLYKCLQLQTPVEGKQYWKFPKHTPLRDRDSMLKLILHPKAKAWVFFPTAFAVIFSAVALLVVQTFGLNFEVTLHITLFVL